MENSENSRNSRRLYNSLCKDKDILKFFGCGEMTYAEILDELACRDFFCSVSPVSTFATGNRRAWYPVLVYGEILDWYDTRTEIQFLEMHTNWFDAMEESIKTAIEIILSENT